MLEAGLSPERVWYIPHGVDTAHFRPASPEERTALRRRLELPEDGLLVVYTGRLLRGKGLETLIDAFAAIAGPPERTLLLLVGSGAGQALSVEDELKDRVRRAGLEPRVRFAGAVPDVSDFLRASDVFAFPSLFEALGIALIEAAACGLACVGSRTGGIVEVIQEGRSGLLCEPGDATGLAACLRRLLGEPELRAALGRGAREAAVSRFDLDGSVERYRALFHEAAGRGAR
jgi:glycosyltransferase involved in cell wall biosynthesis